jgi:hypothetical protein
MFHPKKITLKGNKTIFFSVNVYLFLYTESRNYVRAHTTVAVAGCEISRTPGRYLMKFNLKKHQLEFQGTRNFPFQKVICLIPALLHKILMTQYEFTVLIYVSKKKVLLQNQDQYAFTTVSFCTPFSNIGLIIMLSSNLHVHSSVVNRYVLSFPNSEKRNKEPRENNKQHSRQRSVQLLSSSPPPGLICFQKYSRTAFYRTFSRWETCCNTAQLPPETRFIVCGFAMFWPSESYTPMEVAWLWRKTVTAWCCTVDRKNKTKQNTQTNKQTLWYTASKPQILVLTVSETFKLVTCNVRGS